MYGKGKTACFGRPGTGSASYIFPKTNETDAARSHAKPCMFVCPRGHRTPRGMCLQAASPLQIQKRLNFLACDRARQRWTSGAPLGQICESPLTRLLLLLNVLELACYSRNYFTTHSIKQTRGVLVHQKLIEGHLRNRATVATLGSALHTPSVLSPPSNSPPFDLAKQMIA